MKKNKLFLCAISLLAITLSSCSFSLKDILHVKTSSEDELSEPIPSSVEEPISEDSIIEQKSSEEPIVQSSQQVSSSNAPVSSSLRPTPSSNPAPSSVAPQPSSSDSPKPSSEPEPSSVPQPSSIPAPVSSVTPEPSSSNIISSSTIAPSSQTPEPSSIISSSTSIPTSIPDNSGFKSISEFASSVEIHTAAQKAYLSYAGDYSTMPEDQYPDGKQLLSDSLPVPVSWDYTVPGGKTLSSYSVIFGQKSDLSDGYEVSTGTTKSAQLYNPYLGINYFKLVATFTDGTKDESSIRTFNVDETCPRNLAIGGMTNCRDLGGRPLEDGGKMKQGLVYRTSGFKYDYSTQITEEGKKEMLEHLKVKTEVNVADGTSYNLKLTGTTVKDFKMDYSGGSHHLSRNAESVKNFFNLLGDSNNYPVFFHCRIGTDRTGLCAILLYGLLGVPLNNIYQDYLFSNFGNIQEKRYIGTKAGADNIQNYISDIQNFSGLTFKNKVYNFLLSIGVAKNTLDTVISNLTEGTLAQNNNANQVIARGDVLTGNGVSVSVDTSDRNNPDNYYVLDSTSKSVSYTFNAPQAYEGQIVVYMGNGDSSSSKKIAEAISCKIDSDYIQIRDVSYADARMGKCSSRTNYYPVILGKTDISAGNHTITITGTSNTMNVAGIYIFDGATAPDIGGGANQGQEQGHITHEYVAQTPTTNKAGKTVTTYLCDCGKKYIDIDFFDGYSSLTGNLSDGTNGKLTSGTVVKYDFPAKAGSVQLQFAVKMSSSSHSSQKIDTSKYVIKVNGETKSLAITNGDSYSAIGLSTSFAYITFCEFDIDNDMNVEIELDHNNSSYRLLFGEQVRLMYKS